MNVKTKAIYLDTLYDIILGTDIEELEFVLKDFEADELYEECAGLKKAIDLVKTKSIKDIELLYLELTNNNHEQ